jgi:hypothetical protein
MKSLLSLALLLGASSAISIKNRIRNSRNQLAEAMAGTSHTCQYAINRINAGPADYASYIANGTLYTDTTFPANSEMLRWSDYPGSYSLSQYSSTAGFARLFTAVTNPSLWGSNTPSALDIV